MDTFKEIKETAPAQHIQQERQHFDQTFIPPYNTDLAPHEQRGFQPRQYLLQDGANCGAFASSLAVLSLAKFAAASEQREKAEEGAQLGHEIAEDIQETARLLGLSSVGEFFSAENLVATLNATPTMAANGLLAKLGTFDTPEQLLEILTEAQSRGVKVLVAYYAGDSCEPRTEEHGIQAAEMCNAHWSLINGVDGDSVSIAESNQSMLRPVGINALFRSNQTLLGQFDWSGYLGGLPAGEAAETLRMMGPRLGTGSIEKKEAKDGTHYNEKASLRGKVVLIGVDKSRAER